MTCIGRGITISSPRMMLTHSILPPTCSSISNVYQSSGRLTNNLKGHPYFKIPIVYCTSRVRSSVCLSETRAIELAQKAFKYDKDTVTKDDWTLANKNFTIKTTQFDALEEVKQFVHALGHLGVKNMSLHLIDGFYVTNRVGAKAKVEDLTADDRVLKKEYDSIPACTGFSKGNNFVVIPTYQNKEAINCTFYVRYKVV